MPSKKVEFSHLEIDAIPGIHSVTNGRLGDRAREIALNPVDISQITTFSGRASLTIRRRDREAQWRVVNVTPTLDWQRATAKRQAESDAQAS